MKQRLQDSEESKLLAKTSLTLLEAKLKDTKEELMVMKENDVTRKRDYEEKIQSLLNSIQDLEREKTDRNIRNLTEAGKIKDLRTALEAATNDKMKLEGEISTLRGQLSQIAVVNPHSHIILIRISVYVYSLYSFMYFHNNARHMQAT